MVSPLRQLALLGAIFSILVFGIYWPGLVGDFSNWDDSRFIYENPLFHGGVIEYVRAAISGVQFEAYQPLHLLSYLPDRLLWPQWAPGFRLLGCGLFVACALLLFTIVRRHASVQASALACLLFIVHPLCVEPVAWITSRKDLLSLLFLLLAFRIEDSEAQPTNRRILSACLFAGALLTKTATVVFAPILVVWLVLIRDSSAKEAALRAAPFFALAVAAGLGTTLLWKQHGLIIERPAPLALDIPATYGFYLSRLIAPIDLAALYPRLLPGYSLYAALFVAAAAITLALWKRLPPLMRFSAVAIALALAPVSNVLPLMFRYADRYAFLALVFSAFALAAFLDSITKRLSRRVLVAPVVAASVLFIAASSQARAWKSSEALWRDVVSDQPGSYMGHLKLAETLRDSRDYSGAAKHYREAAAIAPERPLAYAGLIYLYAREKEDVGALVAGTADRWLRMLGPAMRETALLAELRNETLSLGCRRCALMVELLRIKLDSETDASLLDKAEAALEEGMRDFAAVYLNAVADSESARFRALRERLKP